MKLKNYCVDCKHFRRHISLKPQGSFHGDCRRNFDKPTNERDYKDYYRHIHHTCKKWEAK